MEFLNITFRVFELLMLGGCIHKTGYTPPLTNQESLPPVWIPYVFFSIDRPNYFITRDILLMYNREFFSPRMAVLNERRKCDILQMYDWVDGSDIAEYRWFQGLSIILHIYHTLDERLRFLELPRSIRRVLINLLVPLNIYRD